MDIDYHYYMMKVLSYYAGFSKKDAEIIAYACQYVDDANEYASMAFQNIDDLIGAEPDVSAVGLIVGQGGQRRFNRVCTGHDDLQSAGGALPDAQRKTYVPFHFVPSATKDAGHELGNRTSPNCALVGELMDKAAVAVTAQPGQERPLIKLGIALHTFIDSWAHKDFSGFFDRNDNGSDALWARKSGSDFERVDLNFMASVVPETGHAKVHRFPDCSHIVWRYRNPFTGKIWDRDNPTYYMQAARAAFDRLSAASPKLPHAQPWDAIEARVRECTVYTSPHSWRQTDPLDPAVINDKKIHYIRNFPDLDLGVLKKDGRILSAAETEALQGYDGVAVENSYDKFAWKAASFQVFSRVGGEIPIHSEFLNVTKLQTVGAAAVMASADWETWTYRFRSDGEGRLRWVWFQIEADRQRQHVLDRINIPPERLDSVSLMGSQVLALADNLPEGIQRKIASLGGLAAKLGVATALTQKKSWIRVQIINNTAYPLVHKGDPAQDFNLIQTITVGNPVPFGPTNLVEKNVDRGCGKYWEDAVPRNVLPHDAGFFASCERDNNPVNAVAGATRFEIVVNRHIGFTIPFSQPALSESRKITVMDGHGDRFVAWNALGGSHGIPHCRRISTVEGYSIRVTVLPGSNSLIVIDDFNLEEETARANAYWSDHPDAHGAIAGICNAGQSNGNQHDASFLHYLTVGREREHVWGKEEISASVTQLYWDAYPDVAKDGHYGRNGKLGAAGARRHYQAHGRTEGRGWAPLPLIRQQSEAYWNRNPDVADNAEYGRNGKYGIRGASDHFRKHGEAELKAGNSKRYWGL